MEQPEEHRSRLYVLQPLVRKLPEVEIPKRHVPFKEKFMWTGLVLLVFLIMSQIPLYGVAAEAEPWFGSLQFILASSVGTLMELGIGPIVTAGIIMQLLVGSRIIGLNLSNHEDRGLFTGVQKFLAIIIGLLQAALMVIGGHYGSVNMGNGAFIVVQLFLGVLAVLFMDELVSKYGFGSGISLFIAGSVCTTMFWQAFNPTGVPRGGAIPAMIEAIASGSGLSDAFFRAGLPNMMGFFATIGLFFLISYLQRIRVEVPLAYGQFGGIRGRYPIQFFYASVIPVILAQVVFMNIRLIAGLLGGAESSWLWFISSPNGIQGVAARPIHAVIYLIILVFLCTGFAWLWIHMTNMGPKDVARQLYDSGMGIPGFRRDIRTMEKVLERYINTVTLLGGALIGLLAGLADFLGALGSGTGILLTVGILYGLYEEIARERVSEMFPAARRLLGG